MNTQQKEILERLADIEALFNEASLTNALFAEENPNVKRSLEVLERAFKQLSQKIIVQFENAIGPQGILLFEFDPHDPYNFKAFSEELKLYLMDKGASIIVFDLERGVDNLMKAIK